RCVVSAERAVNEVLYGVAEFREEVVVVGGVELVVFLRDHQTTVARDISLLEFVGGMLALTPAPPTVHKTPLYQENPNARPQPLHRTLQRNPRGRPDLSARRNRLRQ